MALHAVAKLPLDTYNEVVTRILAKTPSRDISRWLATLGHEISHSAICGFTRKIVTPATNAAARIEQTQNRITATGTIAPANAAQTYQNLAKQLVSRRLEAKWERYPKWIETVEKEGDIRTAVSIDKAETQALSLQADILGMRFNTVGTSVNMIVVLPGTESSTGTPVEDAEIIDVTDA